MKIGELAKRLRISVSTVRLWSTDEDYRKYLSERAIGGSGATRIYSEQDAQVITTIHKLREEGLLKQEILEALQAGKRDQDPLPEPPTQEETEARKKLTLIPLSQLERALDQIKQKEQQLDRATRERDEALIRLDKQNKQSLDQLQQLNEKIASLSQDLGKARGLMIGALAAAALIAFFLIGALILLLQYLPAAS